MKMTHSRKSESNIEKKEEFYSWFVGFSEGEGSIFTTKKGKDVRFEIWQTRSDTKVLEYIQSELGFGGIRYPSHRPDMAIYVVNKDEEIAKLIAIFTSRMCISRTVTRLNNMLGQNKMRAKPTLETAYLSGLIDAEGCF